MDVFYNHFNNNGWKIITFSNSIIDSEVKSTISGFGYPVRITNGDEWVNVDPVKIIEPTILLFDKKDFPRKKLINILDHSFSVPSVGIFAENYEYFDREIANRCSDFVEWPCNNLEFRARLERIMRFYHPASTPDKNQILDEFSKLNLIGESSLFIKVLHNINKFSKSDAPVLITGETGTGKELVARAIHYQSNRLDYPFVPVNCGAIPDNLIENELFGHARGAYTDAGAAQKGLIEEAEGGTLFLDEVDSLSPKAQVSVLRFLQDQEYRPLGSKQIKRANVRIVAATNADLSDKVSNGSFRNDLYYRLNILLLDLPALRDRKEDITLLADHFLEKFSNQYGNGRKRLHPRTVDWMIQHDWPGNIRELENFILREYLANDALIICCHETTEAENESNRIIFNGVDWNKEGGFSAAKAHIISEFEKNYLDWLLRKTKGNVSDAAKQSGKERRALGKLLKKYAIDKSKYYLS